MKKANKIMLFSSIFLLMLLSLSNLVLGEEDTYGNADQLVSEDEECTIFSFKDEYNPYNAKFSLALSVFDDFGEDGLSATFHMENEDGLLYIISLSLHYGDKDDRDIIFPDNETGDNETQVVIDVRETIGEEEDYLIELDFCDIAKEDELYLVNIDAINNGQSLSLIWEEYFEGNGYSDLSDEKPKNFEAFRHYFKDREAFGVVYLKTNDIVISSLHVEAFGLEPNGSGLVIVLISVFVGSIGAGGYLKHRKNVKGGRD